MMWESLSGTSPAGSLSDIGNRPVEDLVSVVIPVFNEVGNILRVAWATCDALENRCEFEIVFANDGSLDTTAQEIDRAQEVLGERVRNVDLPVRSGQAAAMLAGIEAARGNTIVTVDGDCQDNPEDIMPLLGTYREHDNPQLLVCGGDVLVVRGISRLWHSGKVTGRSGLMVFDRETFLALPHLDNLDRLLPEIYRAFGHPVATCPVHRQPRYSGVSKQIFSRAASLVLDRFAIRRVAAHLINAVNSEKKNKGRG